MTGLYIHIPFCRKKCFYCDFFSVSYTQDIADRYLNALLKEASYFKNEKIETVYIGGGTPSILSCIQTYSLISGLKNIFDLSNLQEFTFEANPESADSDKLKLLYASGITRLSFGLQTVKNSQLKILGRLHSYEKFIEVYKSARNTGFKNINIDLMYGIPEQTFEDWENSLKYTVNLKPEHISLYPLTVEQGTPFCKNNIKTDENIQSKMFDIACSVLKENNFNHYEISNWAKDNNFSRHNVLYWQNREYIGLGTGASSYYKRYRYKNITDINRYIKNINDHADCTSEKEYIDDRLYNAETVMLGLRLAEGVDIKYFENKKDILDKYVSQKMLQIKDNRVSFTQQALFISNGITADFI